MSAGDEPPSGLAVPPPADTDPPPGDSDPPASTPASVPGFRRVVALTLAGTAIPGLGLLAARRWVLGGVVMALFGGTLLALALWVLIDPQSVAALVVRPEALRLVGTALLVVAVLWVLVVAASHLALARRPTGRQRLLGGLLVAALSFAVAAPLTVAARNSYAQADLISSVFGRQDTTRSATRPTLGPGVAPPAPGQPTPDPWRDKPRLNVLLLGGDADDGRPGVRTDTVILASVNTATGDTTLVSLPRQTARMPFPQNSPLRRAYPYGFTDGNGSNPEFFLNAMYTNLPASVPSDILGATDNLGADALKLSVGTALGLPVDYYALVSFEGFQKLVDALGGIRLNVNTYIPIGGNTDRGIPPKEWIAPGQNKLLHGRDALWYARGRYGSTDFDRMDRQRCVINAVIDQANPANLLARYQQIARAGRDLVQTDMPQEVLPMMVDLGLRAKDGDVRSIVFRTGESGFVAADPNFATMRKRVKAALAESRPKPSAGPASVPSAQPQATPTPSARASAKPRASATPINRPAESDDVAGSCAWRPEVAATAQPR